MTGTYALVAAGGAIGACLRFAVVQAALRAFGPGFPWGTLAVNVAGSLAMGVLAAIALRLEGGTIARLSPFLLAGLLGGFTTFSAFSLDAVLLLERGRVAAAALYMGGSVVLSVAALALGLAAARAVLP